MTDYSDLPPQDNQITDYDRAHLKAYLRLIDAEKAGADWREAAKIVLGLDADAYPQDAKQLHDSHLARARWVVAQGYRDLASATP